MTVVCVKLGTTRLAPNAVGTAVEAVVEAGWYVVAAFVPSAPLVSSREGVQTWHRAPRARLGPPRVSLAPPRAVLVLFRAMQATPLDLALLVVLKAERALRAVLGSLPTRRVVAATLVSPAYPAPTGRPFYPETLQRC